MSFRLQGYCKKNKTIRRTKLLYFVGFVCFFSLTFAFSTSFADIYNGDFTGPDEVVSDKKLQQKNNTKKKYPNVNIAFINEIYFDNISNQLSDSIGNRFYTTARTFLNFNITKNLFLNSNIVVQPVDKDYNNPQGFMDYSSGRYSLSSFNNHGLIAEELNLSYKYEKVELFFGKFNPLFGAGSQRYSKIFDNDWYGISGTATNFGYQMREKIGARLDITLLNDEIFSFNDFKKTFSRKKKHSKNEDFDDDFLDEDESESSFSSSRGMFSKFARISFATYKNDESDLFKSSFASKNPTYYNNSIGNNSRLKSYVISFDSYLKSAISKTAVNVSHRRAYNDISDSNARSELANSYAFQHVFYLPARSKIGGFAEYAQISNFAGFDSANQRYRTLSAFAGFNGVIISYVLNKFSSGSSLDSNFAAFSSTNQVYQPYLSDRYSSREVSIGYDFNSGIAVKLGRKKYYDIYRGSNSIGSLNADQVSIRYSINY
jgi:hypothetical protein